VCVCVLGGIQCQYVTKMGQEVRVWVCVCVVRVCVVRSALGML